MRSAPSRASTSSFRQTNHEGALVELIHAARDEACGIVINPAAYNHTSVAVRDAPAACDMPIFEVHISNVHRREAFRHHSYVSAVATGMLAGLAIEGYAAALRRLAQLVHREPRRTSTSSSD